MSFRFLTAGESHGKALVGILEGMPSNLSLNREAIQSELKRRKKGFGRGERQKIESDTVEILSGVRHGKTIGSPISLLIQNKDWENWQTIMSTEAQDKTNERAVTVPRPGHADYVGGLKYQFDDLRNVLERASARETTMRVALGAVAKQFLSELGISIYSQVTEIGGIKATEKSLHWSQVDIQNIEASDLHMLNDNSEIRSLIGSCQAEGNTLGGQFEVVALGAPIGLGSYSQWDRKLDGKLAQAFASLNAIKGFEIGEGFQSSQVKGSEAHDEMYLKDNKIKYSHQRSGGVVAGMTTGQPLLVRCAMKPLSTLKSPLQSVDIQSQKPAAAHFERSDVCAVPSAAVIGESLMALCLTEVILEKFGGDSLEEVKTRIEIWRKQEERMFWK